MADVDRIEEADVAALATATVSAWLLLSLLGGGGEAAADVDCGRGRAVRVYWNGTSPSRAHERLAQQMRGDRRIRGISFRTREQALRELRREFSDTIDPTISAANILKLAAALEVKLSDIALRAEALGGR